MAFVLSLLGLSARAGGDTITRPADCYISTGCGLGYSVFCDQGTSPLVYRGPAVAASVGFAAEWPEWRMDVAVDFVGGTYINRFQKKLNFNNLGGRLCFEGSVMHSVCQRGRWRIWVGVALADAPGLRYNPNLNNSSTTFDNFAILDIRGRAEYSLGRWLFHAQAAVSPLSVSFRPGYAFINNYSATNEAGALLLNNYRWSAGALCHIGTDIGATLKLRNGNTLGLNYLWDFLTTGERSGNRLAEASHLLVFSFNFKLN